MGNADKYNEEFKINAVNLARSSNRSIREIAFELGVGYSTISRWCRNSKLGRTSKLSTTKQLTPQEGELKKALKELAIVREERDILKKAFGNTHYQQKGEVRLYEKAQNYLFGRTDVQGFRSLSSRVLSLLKAYSEQATTRG